MSYGSLFSSKLVGEGRFAEAVDTATKEIGLLPDEPDAYFQRGQAHAGLGQLEQAVADYAAALSMDASGSSLDPEIVDDELFFALRTLAATQKTDPARAAETLRRYAAILPNGRHVADIAKWVDNFNGVEEVWYRERA
jgi:tetratricopeptide (TPR) repeat protein